MFSTNIKEIITLVIGLATLTGIMPVIISPIPVFASQEEGEKKPYDYAEAGLTANDTTASTTSASVKVSNSLDESVTIPNLNGEVDNEWSSKNSFENMDGTVIINAIKFQLTDQRSKCVSVTGNCLKANTDLVLPSEIKCNGQTFNVTSIGKSALKNCKKITSIAIPSSIENIENEAFLGCTSLTKINVDTYNKNYESKDGVLFNKNAIKLIQYPIEKTDEKYEIPSSVIKIEDYAFLGCNWNLKYIVHNDDIKKYLLGCKSRIQAYQITVVTLDTRKLEKLYDVYKEMEQENYIDESFKIFIDALHYAKNVLDKKTTATQTEVDNTEKALREAINALKEKVEVTGITVSGADYISQSGGSTNLTVNVSPDDATNTNVRWSIVSGDSLASISKDGTLTASKSGNGSLTVRATAKDRSDIYGDKIIIIDNNGSYIITTSDGVNQTVTPSGNLNITENNDSSYIIKSNSSSSSKSKSSKIGVNSADEVATIMIVINEVTGVNKINWILYLIL